MRTYETIFILKPTATAEEQATHIDFYKENIRKFGGEIVKEEIWGKQQFAYKIDGLSEGIYVLLQFTAENSYPNTELDKRFKFNEDIIRYVIVMLDGRKFKAAPRKEPARKPRVETEKVAIKSESSEVTVTTDIAVETITVDTVTETVTADTVTETITADTVTETIIATNIVVEPVASAKIEEVDTTNLDDENPSTDKKAEL